jgi:hypothetical protein
VIVLTAGAGRTSAVPASSYDHLDHLAIVVLDGARSCGWAGRLMDIGIGHVRIVLEVAHHSLRLPDPNDITIDLVAP